MTTKKRNKLLAKYPAGLTIYYIENSHIVSVTIHSGLSPITAYTLSKVYRIYKSRSKAEEALALYKTKFT